MPAKLVNEYKVTCPDCKWKMTYDDLPTAESAVKLHNKDEHDVIAELDGFMLVMDRPNNQYIIKLPVDALNNVQGVTLSDDAAYLAGLAYNNPGGI